jgi:hypothetical protein
MTSQRKIEANRRNAGLSIGARSLSGKAPSARNARRTGWPFQLRALLLDHKRVLPAVGRRFALPDRSRQAMAAEFSKRPITIGFCGRRKTKGCQ